MIWGGAPAASTAAIAASSASGGAVNAALAESIADFTLGGAVKVPAHASLAESFADFTLAGSVKVPAHASLAGSLADFTLAGSVKVPAHASLAETLADVTLAATARAPAHAALAESLADVTLAATATAPAHAALAEIFVDFTLAGTAHVPGAGVHASLAETLADVTLAATARTPAHASLAESFAAVTLSGSARAPAHASLAETLAGISLAGMARVPAHAALAAPIGDVLLSSTAHVAGPCITPRLMVRTAALGALAAGAASGDPCCAPLVGAQIFLGQTWPSQSPQPGSAAMPNQLLLYGWDEKSETVSGKTTAPKFSSVLTVVIEARVETKSPAATAVLPAEPGAAAIDAAVDGALDRLTYAVKKAICQWIGSAATALNGRPVIEEIRRIDTASKYSETGQRMAGNGAVAFDLVYGEWFEPPILAFLEQATILISPQAGATSNHGNTGNGTVGPVAIGLGAEPGSYLVAFTSPTAFTVTLPDGSAGGSGTVGASFAGGGLTFAIAAGTTPFVAGDGFTVFVEVQAENYITFS